jgi:hypothetical protein
LAWAPLHWVRAAWVPPPLCGGRAPRPWPAWALLAPWLPSLGLVPPVPGPGLCPTGGTPRPLGGDKTGAPAMQATPGHCKPAQDRAAPRQDRTGAGPQHTARHTRHERQPGAPNTTQAHNRTPQHTQEAHAPPRVCYFGLGYFGPYGRGVLHRAFCCFCPTYVRSYAPWLGLGMVT